MQGRTILAVLFGGGGLFVMVASTVFWSTFAAAAHAPQWVLFLCGLVFFIASVMIVVGQEAPVNNLLAALVLFAMSAIGLWAALFGDAEKISGGLPFLPHAVNVMIARWLFGFGAIITGLLGLYAVRLYRRKAAEASDDEGSTVID